MSDAVTESMNAMRQLGIRLPDDLYAWLAALAERERRSLNAQLIVVIEAAKAEAERKQRD